MMYYIKDFKLHEKFAENILWCLYFSLSLIEIKTEKITIKRQSNYKYEKVYCPIIQLIKYITHYIILNEKDKEENKN